MALIRSRRLPEHSKLNRSIALGFRRHNSGEKLVQERLRNGTAYREYLLVGRDLEDRRTAVILGVRGIDDIQRALRQRILEGHDDVGRAEGTVRYRLLGLLLDDILTVGAREAGVELSDVQTDLRRDLRQLGRVETVVAGRDAVQSIDVLPIDRVPAQVSRAFGRLGLMRRLGVKLRNGEVAEDPGHARRVGRLELFDFGMKFFAEGAFQIGELDQFYRCVQATYDVVRSRNRLDLGEISGLDRAWQISRLVPIAISPTGRIDDGDRDEDRRDQNAYRQKVVPLFLRSFLFHRWNNTPGRKNLEAGYPARIRLPYIRRLG